MQAAEAVEAIALAPLARGMIAVMSLRFFMLQMCRRNGGVSRKQQSWLEFETRRMKTPSLRRYFPGYVFV